MLVLFRDSIIRLVSYPWPDLLPNALPQLLTALGLRLQPAHRRALTLLFDPLRAGRVRAVDFAAAMLPAPPRPDTASPPATPRDSDNQESAKDAASTGLEVRPGTSCSDMVAVPLLSIQERLRARAGASRQKLLAQFRPYDVEGTGFVDAVR